MVTGEDRTRQYSVYITDKDTTVNGSGVLYYPGGGTMFVFTCAHVVDDLETVRIFVLKPLDVEKDQYEVFTTDVSREQVYFSPLDTVTMDHEVKVHSEDLAIIEIKKPETFDIAPTDYFVGESSRHNPIYTQGYPNGVPAGQNPVEYLECLHGSVVLNIADNNRFTIRIEENYLDQGNRVYELRGLSGAPIWDGKSDVETQSLLGLISSAYDKTALLSKIFAMKSQQIRSLMNEKFGITIERKLVDIPDEDVAGGTFKPIEFDGSVSKAEKSDAEKWIEEQTAACRCSIDDLKLQKAIDIAKAVICDERFESCGFDSKKRIVQYLLYCYEIGDLDAEFDELETEMVEKGFFKKYDILRHLTRSFMKKQYKETIAVAEDCLSDPDNESKTTLIACAKSFLILAKAYEENLPVEETIGSLLDEHENFIYQTDDLEDSGLIYQMIGYVYGECYHDNVNAVRFLNRSYRIGFDNIVLESLGAAYYFLGITDATREDGTVDYQKIDQKSLYKARECFLIIIGKADELFWSGTVRRIGLCIYNTFVFLQDNYRILTIYPDIKKYITVLPEQEDEHTFWRDIEMKYARIAAQSGKINTYDYPHINRSDRILLETIAKTSECENYIEQAIANFRPEQVKASGLEQIIKQAIRDTENNVRVIDRRDRTPVYVQLMNMYGRGMLLFGWKKIDKLHYCRERLQECNDDELLESMDNFIYEYEAPMDDVIARFRQTFDKRKNLRSWQELNHLYVRHGMMDQADAMYKELLAERKELIAEGPEYAYRAYIDYITLYHRDMKDALQCYLDAKEAFQDTDIEGFWELELMVYTNTFNDPERFEIERKPFMEKGLLTEEQYHRTAFIAYMVNLNEEKAREHNEYIRHYPHYVNPVNNMLILQLEEIHFLNWIGQIKPSFLPPPQSMTSERAVLVRSRLMNESWHREIDKPFRNQFSIDKTAVIDAWALYIMVENGKLDDFLKFDHVYISHSTITRLLDELSRTDNQKIRELLDYVKAHDVFTMYSASFKSQMEVRNAVVYSEPTSAVAVSIEKKCIAILGDPDLDRGTVEIFGSRIVRVTEIGKLFEK